MKLLFNGFMVLFLFCVASLAPAYAVEINVSGAASMKDVLTELTATFTRNSPGTRFKNNFGGSGAVAKQIENGAPADLFVSANPDWIDYLKDKKIIDYNSIRTLAFNVLVFVGKPDSRIKTMRDVITLDKIAIGSPRSVPAGEYAVAAFKKAGIDKQLENKLVIAKDVRECLLYADRGEVSGAFVYKTDYDQASKNVKILFVVPQDLYPRVVYPMGLTVNGAKKPEAAAFFRFLQSPEAEKVLLKYGFMTR